MQPVEQGYFGGQARTHSKSRVLTTLKTSPLMFQKLKRRVIPYAGIVGKPGFGGNLAI